jgi:L,D-transpeptidase ErfK/SrfK
LRAWSSLRLSTFAVVASLGAGCGHAPPVTAGREPVAAAVAAPEPACEVNRSPDCRPFGDCSESEVIGAVCSRTVRDGESLIELARAYDLGFNAIAAANPDLDPFVPGPGATVTIPTAWIVPRAAAPGTLVVNLSDMRLYLFPASPGAPMSFPVGIGSEGWTTPVGTFTVVQKQANPRWYPPPSIRKENPDLPAMVPPGPDNPLGTHALRLSRGAILIHGTDTPFGVGRRASHGCLRLYPEDIPHLYERVPVGTRVTIVREPVKVGLREGRVYVEAHPDDSARLDYAAEARRLLSRRGLIDRVEARKLDVAVQERRGIPVDVSAEQLETRQESRPGAATPGA